MSHRDAGSTSSPPPASTPSPGPHRDDRENDEVLAAVLIRMWTLASGRTLRRDVPPDQLSEEELIAFWADDLTPPAGRHAKTGTARHRALRAPASAKAARLAVRSRGRSQRQAGGRAQDGWPERPVGTASRLRGRLTGFVSRRCRFCRRGIGGTRSQCSSSGSRDRAVR
jgi:hypothetical protein